MGSLKIHDGSDALIRLLSGIRNCLKFPCLSSAPQRPCGRLFFSSLSLVRVTARGLEKRRTCGLELSDLSSLPTPSTGP